MTLRIIGGKFKSRKIIAPKGSQTRPTSDMVRGAVFNILQHYDRSRFLDLFAGSGAMGLEAISRGSKEAIFIDDNQAAIQCIIKNISTLEVKTQCQVQKTSSLNFIQQNPKPFDIIYIDPPYGKGVLESLLIEIHARTLLTPLGMLLVEESIPLTHLSPQKIKKYGSTYLNIFSLSKPAS